jgi:hypothetical protein
MSPTPPVEAFAIAAALAWLALSVMFTRAVRGTGPSRGRRIVLPASWFVLGAALTYAVPLFFLIPPAFVLRALVWGAPWVALPAFLSAAIAEGIVFALNAERTRQWLCAGIVSAIVVTYGGLLALIGDLFFRAEPVVIVPALVAASAAIIWWPYLPRPEGTEEDDEDAAEVFG